MNICNIRRKKGEFDKPLSIEDNQFNLSYIFLSSHLLMATNNFDIYVPSTIGILLIYKSISCPEMKKAVKMNYIMISNELMFSFIINNSCVSSHPIPSCRVF